MPLWKITSEKKREEYISKTTSVKTLQNRALKDTSKHIQEKAIDKLTSEESSGVLLRIIYGKYSKYIRKAALLKLDYSECRNTIREMARKDGELSGYAIRCYITPMTVIC